MRVNKQRGLRPLLNTEGKIMSYFESAEGVSITRKRALKEIKDHGMMSELDQFDKDLGVKESYSAQAVLVWLGY